MPSGAAFAALASAGALSYDSPMRTEIEAIVGQIEQSLALLRRHL